PCRESLVTDDGVILSGRRPHGCRSVDRSGSRWRRHLTTRPVGDWIPLAPGTPSGPGPPGPVPDGRDSRDGHQFQRPRRAAIEGTSRVLTKNVSSRIPKATVTPSWRD